MVKCVLARSAQTHKGGRSFLLAAALVVTTGGGNNGNGRIYWQSLGRFTIEGGRIGDGRCYWQPWSLKSKEEGWGNLSTPSETMGKNSPTWVLKKIKTQTARKEQTDTTAKQQRATRDYYFVGQAFFP